MASIKQIEANRSNALNGTGPRTAEGKARSSRNALTHGLTAQEIVIPGEDVAAYRSFEQQLIDDLATMVARLGCFPTTYRLPGEEASPEEEFLDRHTSLRWSGRDPYQLKVLGRLLDHALTGDGVLLKLNTYEARLLRQSQQLLGQFFALRKARTADVLLDDVKENPHSKAINRRG